MNEPEPTPDDAGYWASHEAEGALVPDYGDEGFVDTRPPVYAAVQPLPPQPLLPQVVAEGLVNLEAEAALLGALMIDNRCATQLGGLVADDFGDPMLGRIFQAVINAIDAGKKANPVTLWPLFVKDAAMAELGGPGYLATLTQNSAALLAFKDHAGAVAELAQRRRLAGVAQQVAQTIADPHSDISAALAWMDEARKSQSANRAALQSTCMASLAGIDIAPRAWVVKGWLPANAVTLIAGPGGVGKSLAVQQWMTAISLGIDWLGAETLAGVPCLYVTCEDEADEVARRNADISAALGYNVKALADMHTISLAGAEGNELGVFDGERRFRPTERFHAIVATAKALGARVVALDNVAHLFTGNENVRGEVTQFVNLLTRLAQEIAGSVILLGHPAKADGSEYSGSTAWENAVRSRLFLCRPEGENDAEIDPNARQLVRSKANYAAKDEALNMVWHHGAFIPPSAVPEADKPQFEAAGIYNERFLDCLDLSIRQGRAVSHNPRAGNYAPRQFAKMPGNKSMTPAHFEGAMERLLSLGEIITDAQMGWRDAARRPVIGLGRA